MQIEAGFVDRVTSISPEGQDNSSEYEGRTGVIPIEKMSGINAKRRIFREVRINTNF